MYSSQKENAPKYPTNVVGKNREKRQATCSGSNERRRIRDETLKPEKKPRLEMLPTRIFSLKPTKKRERE